MLRPEVYIGVYKVKSNIEVELPLQFKYLIKVDSLDIQENRDGISCTIKTKHDRYALEEGDVLKIETGYALNELTITTLPIMVVTSVILMYDNTLEILAVDEFQYHCQTTNFNPIDLSKNQQEFFDKNFKFGPDATKLPELTLKQILGWIQSLISPKMFYHKKTIPRDGYPTTLESSGMFNVQTGYKSKVNPNGLITLDANVGKWQVQNYVKVSEVINVLKTKYGYNIFMMSSSYNQDNKYRQRVNVIGLDSSSPNNKPNHDFHFYDDVNIIKDKLVYSNPKLSRQAIKGTFITKTTTGTGKDQKTESETEYIYAYYNENNEITTSNTVSNDYVYSNIKINDASLLSEEDKKKYVINMLKSAEYKGYRGNIDTFNYSLNIYDRVTFKFYNFNTYGDNQEINREDGTYAINTISRNYSTSGLFMSITLRQQLEYKGNEWVDFGVKK